MTANTVKEVSIMEAIKAITDAVVSMVKESGTNGKPSGHIYAVLMTHGITLEQYESIMATLVRLGKLRKSGQLYFYV